MKKLLIHPKKKAALSRLHPWLFSGAIKAMPDGEPEDGEVVQVIDNQDNVLATGHYQKRSICVQILSFGDAIINRNFWNSKIKNAYDYRTRLGLTDNKDTNCYRLLHGEGDGVPGLIVDIYGTTAVVQCHSIGMHLARVEIAETLMEVFGEKLTAVFDKSAETLPSSFAIGVDNDYLIGTAAPTEVLENGHRFFVNWEEGQKTGFFLDQRDNRALISKYAAGKSVLNAFSYSGGFSIYALNAGAKEVHSVDLSEKAIDWTAKNVTLNCEANAPHEGYAEDVLEFLKNNKNIYDLMVIDPPAYAKNFRKRHKAVIGYKRLNALAIKQLAPNGLLFTFSCSQVVEQQLFYDTIMAAGIEAGRNIRVMHHLTQPADHPVNLFHPEGKYLKGLVLQVD